MPIDITSCQSLMCQRRLLRLLNEPQGCGSDEGPDPILEHNGVDFHDGRPSQVDALGSSFLYRPPKQAFSRQEGRIIG